MGLSSTALPSDSPLVSQDGAQAERSITAATPIAAVNACNVSLLVLAVLASVFMLRWASAIFFPIMGGLLFSYSLSPVVN